jgi:hypothetical protein
MKLLQFKPIELPEPQISDTELVNISKLANVGRREGFSLKDNPTEVLVGDYST